MAALKKDKPGGAAPAPHALVTAGLCLIAAGVPLAWSRFVLDEYILPEVVVLSAGLLLAALGTALSRPRFFSTELDRPLAAALLAWTLAAAFSIDPRFSALGTYGGYTYGLWQVASCAAVFRLTAGCDAKTRRLVLKAALSAAMLAGAYAVLQVAGLDPLVPVQDLPNHRALSTLASPVFLGAYLALWLPVALHWALSEPGEERFGAAAVALICAGLLASVSRGAWLGAALGAGVYLKLTGRLRVPRWHWCRWAAVAVLAGLAALWSVRALERRDASSVGQENTRVAIWSMAGRIFIRHPWLGNGPDTFEQGLRQVRTEDFIRLLGQGYRLGHAHNELLQVLATTGLLGLAAYLWLIFGLSAAARGALAGEDGRARAAALAAGLAALFFNLQFNIGSLPSYVSAALAAGELCAAREENSPGAAVWRLKNAAMLLLAAGGVFLSLRLAAADHEFKLAHAAADRAEAARRYRAALALNPCELGYHLAYVNHLVDDSAKLAGAERLGPVDLIARTGATAVACHPRDAVAHFIGGSAALMQATMGRPESLAAAEAELDAALLLDPYRLDLLDWRRQAASLRGDRDLERRLLDRLARARSLHR